MSTNDTAYERQIRNAMKAIDTLSATPDRESLTAIRRIVDYGTLKRTELQTRLLEAYAYEEKITA